MIPFFAILEGVIVACKQASDRRRRETVCRKEAADRWKEMRQKPWTCSGCRRTLGWRYRDKILTWGPAGFYEIEGLVVIDCVCGERASAETPHSDNCECCECFDRPSDESDESDESEPAIDGPVFCVSSDGDDSNDGTVAKPLRTFAEVMRRLKALEGQGA